jgi:hypothetical protein
MATDKKVKPCWNSASGRENGSPPAVLSLTCVVALGLNWHASRSICITWPTSPDIQ